MADRGCVLAVVPTLGERTDTLGAALASVRAQEGISTTLVVVVPATATEARAIAKEFGALVVDDPRRGLSAAVNAGIEAADGESYFAWIGDDDELYPTGLRTLADLLEADHGAVVSFGACDYMDDAGRVFAVSRAGRWARRVLAWGPDLIPQPASLTRLPAIRAVGAYDEGLRFVMDLDMFLRLRRQGRFLTTGERIASYRWHPDALTVANRGISIAEAEKVKRRHLPGPLRPLAPVWDAPVRLAITLVSKQLSRRARAGRHVD
ncbi:glycosyltransferase [Intrasporangium flavum]|uniref:glycosyltransferase n=1 Tax=Intrasporangium flavum TaxID=1428657 RepID=UPI00096F1985|nr:glycosyltransferase [Intrasporangium flavum]